MELNQILPSTEFIKGNIGESSAKLATLSLVFYEDYLVFLAESPTGEILTRGRFPFPSAAFTAVDVNQLLAKLPFLAYPFKKVWAAVSNKQYCLIPAFLHQRHQNEEYLSFSLGQNSDNFSLVKQDNLFTLDLVMIYNISSQLEKFLINLHPGISIRHEKSILALKALSLAKEIEGLMLINLCEKHFDLLLIEDNKLLFFNTFPMQNTDELLYYVFDVLKQLNLKQSSFKPRVCGLAPDFLQTELLTKYLPGLEKQFHPENMPEQLVFKGMFFTAYHLIK